MIREKGKELFFRFQWLQDLLYWRRLFDLYPETKLLIMDPVVSYLGKGVNDQKNDEVRSAIEPFLEEIIRPRGICFFANTHLNKTLEAKSVQHRITGSIAYVNLPRNVHCVYRDANDPEVRIFGQCKCNNAPDHLKSLEFKIVKQAVMSASGEIETSTPIFSHDLIDVDWKRAMSGDKGARGPKPVKSSELAGWLFDQLKGGRVPLGDLIDDAREAGFLPLPTATHPDPKATSLYHAKRRLPKVHAGWQVCDTTVGNRIAWELVKTEDSNPTSDATPF